MALRIAIFASVLALISSQGVPHRPTVNSATTTAAAGTFPRRSVTPAGSSASTPVDFSLSAGAALQSGQTTATSTSYGWLQQTATYTAFSTVTSVGTWEAGNIWFQLQDDPTAYWLLQIGHCDNLLPDFGVALKSIQNSLGYSHSVQLQVGWVLDPSQRAVVVDFLVTAVSTSHRSSY